VPRRACLLPGLLTLAVLAVLGGALPATAAALPARAPRARVRPRAFASCAGLIAYARQHLATTHGRPEPAVAPVAQTGPAQAPLGAAAPTAPATTGPNNGASGTTPTFSTTNNQEPGVDEPDIVKTDGSTIFAVAGGTLYAVTAAAGTPRLAGSLALGPGGYGAQLLLRGSHLVVISGNGPIPLGVVRPVLPGPVLGGQTVLTEVDVHDPAAMKVTRTMTLDGRFVDARRNGATARVVISSTPRAIAVAGARGQASGWLPGGRFHSLISGRRYARAITPCNAVSRPVQFSGLGVLTIVTLDLDRGLWTAESTALMADPQVVYGSQNSLYVATQKWIDPGTAPGQLPPSQTTVIDRFDATKADQTPLVSSGEVPGFLLNQFSLSEYNGFLRVASTARPIWWGGGAVPSVRASPAIPVPGPRPTPLPVPPPSQSYVTVLAERGGSLTPVGQVSGLGAGQQIYSVRFVGDAGYVVTFRQVDPLYTIDLSTPTAPRVAGALELQGYSAYLHPVGDGLLLGVGQDVGPAANEPSGTQLELFDVSNPAAPKLLARTTLGSGSSSEVQTDHHAFLFWPPTKLAVLPVEIAPLSPQAPPTAMSAPAPPSAGAPGFTGGGGPGFTGAIGFRVDASGIAEVGRVVHDPVGGQAPPIRRSIVIGDRLFTLSDAGVMASRLDTLARLAFVPFPPGVSPVGPPTPSPGAGQ